MQQSSSIVGVCALCRKSGVGLCYSDLLPKAIARWIVKSAPPGQANPNPVFVTAEGAKQVNYRLAEYLLCPECEDRFNKGGESWTLRNAYRGRGSFPLRDALRAAPSKYVLDRGKIIDGSSVPGIDLKKLAYFGISVFWRGSAIRWKGPGGGLQLPLGPYREKLRRFLLGTGPFPDRASLVVCSADSDVPLFVTTYPYRGENKVVGTTQYKFGIPGMTFWLHLGEIPQGLSLLCAHHSGALGLMTDLDQIFVDEVSKLTATPTFQWD